jgi:SAM-dependent methyltransferase
VTGFSADWLASREPADHAGRNGEVLARLAAYFAAREEVAVVDLGCGTGSNLRATAPYLPRRQRWLLVDHDPALLRAARQRLREWAERSEQAGDAITLWHAGRELEVSFRQADLAGDLGAVLDADADLVTAAALFDLVSRPWIEDFARAVARLRAAVYVALTYDGVEIWTPAHPADAEILAAFNEHQRGDKGFGPSAGPDAATLLARVFRRLAYDVTTGESPTPFDRHLDAAVIRDIVECVCAAARDMGKVAPSLIAEWVEARGEGASCTIGHTDLLALPARS